MRDCNARFKEDEATVDDRKVPRWRLRSGLVLPAVLIVPLFLAVTGVLWEGVAHREADALVAKRQDTALTGLSAQLSERRQANETIAFLLSKREGIGDFIESRNTLRLLQTFVVMQAALGVDYIDVHASNGERLVHISGSGTDRLNGELVAGAIFGHNGSSIVSDAGGLIVAAAASVSGSSHTAGALVVGSLVPARMLVNSMSTVDVALFQNGQLVDSSVARDDLLPHLTAPISSADDVDGLNAALAPLHFRAAGLQLSPGNVVMALVRVNDLDRASQQRAAVVIGGTAALMLALILMAVIQARAIARPLEKLVVVAGALVRGEYRRMEPSQNYEVDSLGRAVNELADQLDRKLAEVTHQATHDPLSSLPNRKLFLECLREALHESSGVGVAVLFLDLDSFKVVNDSLGHASGDQLIVAVARRITDCLREEPALLATVARMGGDEFTILLPRAADDLSARRVADRLAHSLSQPFYLDEHELVVTTSIGIARSAPGLSSAEAMLRAADVAMYRAKASGRGTYVVYESAMGRHAADRLDRETELRQAIEAGALCVYYQPVVELSSGRVHELEALVRWNHPQRGVVSPAEFIPLAEETGLIVPVGRHVLTEACRQLRALQLRYPSDEALRLNVNLSARQLLQPDLVQTVRKLLHENDIAPERLTLEITESCLMQDSDARQLQALSGVGIKLAVDDFGTGNSSLAYLSRLPINTLKIDRSFVARLGQEPESTAVVETIIAMSNALRLSVTAEGIENAQQAAHLQALGCRRGQGFFYARAAPIEELELNWSDGAAFAA